MKAGTHAESRQVERVALFLALVYKCGGDGGAVISSGSAVYLRLANAGTCVAQAVRSRSAHVTRSKDWEPMGYAQRIPQALAVCRVVSDVGRPPLALVRASSSQRET